MRECFDFAQGICLGDIGNWGGSDSNINGKVFGINQKNKNPKHRPQYTQETKQKAINLYKVHGKIIKVSRQLKVPQTTVKRWLKFGIQRRGVSGKKCIDPSMEYQLYQWIQNCQQKPKKETIIEKAKLLSSKAYFKASKGWYTRFCRRFNL